MSVFYQYPMVAPETRPQSPEMTKDKWSGDGRERREIAAAGDIYLCFEKGRLHGRIIGENSLGWVPVEKYKRIGGKRDGCQC